MPTAAKLFAAVAFTLVGFLAAEIFKPHMPEGTQFGFFSQISALIGLVCGWRVIGREAGHGWWESANAGMKTIVAMLALALLIFSIEEMLVQAFRRSYDSPMEAVIGTISRSKRFSAHALIAFCWLSRPKRSVSSRVMPYSLAMRSAPSNCDVAS